MDWISQSQWTIYLGIFFLGIASYKITQTVHDGVVNLKKSIQEKRIEREKKRMEEKRLREEEMEKAKFRRLELEKIREEEDCKKGIHSTVYDYLFTVKIHKSLGRNPYYNDRVGKCKRCGGLMLDKEYDSRKLKKNEITQTEVRAVLRHYKDNVSKSFEKYNMENFGLKTRKEYQDYLSTYKERIEILKPYCDEDWLEENEIKQVEVVLDGY